MANFTKQVTPLIESLPPVQLSPVTPLLQAKQPLWNAFDAAFTRLAGYPATEFRFVPGQTPLATGGETAAVLLSYYAVILGGREVMRNRKPFSVHSLFIMHNFILTAVSAALLALFAEQLLPMLAHGGLHKSICGADSWTKQLNILYYINYIVKYVELLDTVFLVLKKKPLTFLHTYHHGATALLCYTQLVGRTPVSWVPIVLNLGVHVVMYYYYYESARGHKVSWKQRITDLQIAQFVIDIFAIYFATYTFVASDMLRSWNMPHVASGCAGEPTAAFTGCAILSSYLVLFLGFYAKTYGGKKRGGRVESRNVTTGKVGSG